MSRNITVSSRLLEDIFRILEYLSGLSGYDELHFNKAGYSQRLTNDNAIWELKQKIRQLQEQIVETYLLTVGFVTEDEKHALREWIAAGNGVYDNPYFLFDGSGNLMDFINGRRIYLEMAEDIFCSLERESDTAGDGWENDYELPF